MGAEGLRLPGDHRAAASPTSSATTARRTACCRSSSPPTTSTRSPRPATRRSTSPRRRSAGRAARAFEIDPEIKHRLLNGLDDISLTLQQEERSPPTSATASAPARSRRRCEPWDAATYDKVADPQEAWAREILERAGLRAAATACSTPAAAAGGVTRLLLERAPARHRRRRRRGDGRQGARDAAGRRAGAAPGPARARRSTSPSTSSSPCAVFHWITDHERLFARLRAALRPGGRLVAQCGGHGNIARVLELVGDRHGHVALRDAPRTPSERLRDAGFSRPAPGSSPSRPYVGDMETFIATVSSTASPTPREPRRARRAAARPPRLRAAEHRRHRVAARTRTADDRSIRRKNWQSTAD